MHTPTQRDVVCCLQRRFPWVFAMVENQQETSDFELGEVLPGAETEAALQKVREAKKWISTLPLSKRPLVKVRIGSASAVTISWHNCLQASLCNRQCHAAAQGACLVV